MKKYVTKVLGTTLLFCSNLALGMYADCSAPQNRMYYQQGFQIESNVIQQLFSYSFQNDCTNLESFIAAVDVPFAKGMSRTPALRCRNLGLADGLSHALNEITNNCVTDCLQDGYDVGQLFGNQFCGVPDVQAMMRAEVRLCNFTASQSCKTALMGTVNQFCPSKQFEAQSFADSVCQF